jgi:putative FmdB family regulatory protein
MPIYEYACHACGHEFEIIQKMVDLPLEQCPVCTENTLKKKISAVGFRLKGTGWYETDFKNKNKSVNKNPVEKPDEKVEKKDESSANSETSTSTTSNGTAETEKSSSEKSSSRVAS